MFYHVVSFPNAAKSHAIGWLTSPVQLFSFCYKDFVLTLKKNLKSKGKLKLWLCPTMQAWLALVLLLFGLAWDILEIRSPVAQISLQLGM